MKCHSIGFGFILHSCIPVSSNLTSFAEMDYLSRKFCLCFLTVKTFQVCYNKIPFLSESRLNFFRRFNPSSQRGVAITSVKCTNESIFDQSSPVKNTTMGKKGRTFSTEKVVPWKKLKVETLKEKEPVGSKRQRPNYFVAVQISNPKIHESIQRIQDHMISQNIKLNACMNSLATLHITLMVMNITDSETHERALKALHNVHEEYNDEMCNNPLRLEFCGLGHFKNRVLYAKMKENESLERLRGLAESVRKHFADSEIFSTDERDFNPHLTIAKIDFSKKKQKGLKKIEPTLYETYANELVGFETVAGIQLLNMTSPKNEEGYYVGENLTFESNTTSSCTEANIAEVNEKKKDIRMKIADLTKKLLK